MYIYIYLYIYIQNYGSHPFCRQCLLSQVCCSKHVNKIKKSLWISYIQWVMEKNNTGSKAETVVVRRTVGVIPLRESSEFMAKKPNKL